MSLSSSAPEWPSAAWQRKARSLTRLSVVAIGPPFGDGQSRLPPSSRPVPQWHTCRPGYSRPSRPAAFSEWSRCRPASTFAWRRRDRRVVRVSGPDRVGVIGVEEVREIAAAPSIHGLMFSASCMNAGKPCRPRRLGELEDQDRERRGAVRPAFRPVRPACRRVHVLGDRFVADPSRRVHRSRRRWRSADLARRGTPCCSTIVPLSVPGMKFLYSSSRIPAPWRLRAN